MGRGGWRRRLCVGSEAVAAVAMERKQRRGQKWSMRSWGSDYTKGVDSGWLMVAVEATRSEAAETMGGGLFFVWETLRSTS